MKRFTYGFGVFAVLLIQGCGQATIDSKRQAVEKAARQEFERLRKNGEAALEAKRFEEAVKDLTEAVALQDDSQASELLHQATKSWNENRKIAYEKAFVIGTKAVKENNHRAAVLAFRDALRQMPDDKEATSALQKAEAALKEEIRAAAYHKAIFTGRSALEVKQYPVAIAAFMEAISLAAPEDKEAKDLYMDASYQELLEKGMVQLQEKQYGEAYKNLVDAAKIKSDNPTIQRLLKDARTQRRIQIMALGRQALKDNRFADAAQAFAEARSLLADDEVDRLLAEAERLNSRQLAEKEIIAHNFDAAIVKLEEALLKKPGDEEANKLLRLAKDGRDAKKRKDDEEVARALAAGDAAFQRKDYQTAVNAYSEVLNKHPENVAAFSKHLQAQIEERKESKQRKEADENVRAMVVGGAEFQRKGYPSANNAISETLKKQTVEAKASSKPYQITTEEGKDSRLRKDKEDYARAIKKGDEALQRKDYQSAIKEYSEALMKQQGDATALSKKLQAQTEEGKDIKQRKDKEDYTRAILDGDTALQRKDYQSAIDKYSEALSKQPGDANATFKRTQAQTAKSKKESFDRHMSMGKTHMSVKNFNAAATEFLLATIDLPTDLEAQRLLQQARQSKK